MYVISYDLSSNRLRNKVAKELENYGKRVQYSVFECRITQKQLRELYQKLSNIMLAEENGSIRIYSICANCETKVRIIGIKESGLTTEEEDLFVV